MKYLALPTWLLLMLARPYLPKAHPMRRPLTLEDWWLHQTDKARACDVGLWIGLLCSALLALPSI